MLRVRGLDAIDGTLVLDIKPYFPVYDHVPGAVVPEWVERLMKGCFMPRSEKKPRARAIPELAKGPVQGGGGWLAGLPGSNFSS